MKQWLESTFYIDSNNPEIAGFVRSVAGDLVDPLEKAVKLYYAVRDGIRYDPYKLTYNRDLYIASHVLEEGVGFCVQKAILLTAVSRAAGIPCRIGFANVKNHLVTKRLKELMKSDLFVFHGYSEFLIEEKWVKATPAFNLSLCEKFGVFPLEFDGRSDSVFHPFDKDGKQHMEYVHDYGSFDDFPFEMMIAEHKKHYQGLYELVVKHERQVTGDFEQEASDENIIS